MTRITFTRAPRKPIGLLVSNPIYKAFGRKPISHDKWVGLSLDARMVLARVELGAMEPDDRSWLACTVNVAMILTEQYGTDDDLADTTAARDAMARADQRAAQGKNWLLDGSGREAVRRALEIHDEQLKIRGQSAITNAILTMHNRTARGQVLGVPK